MQTLKLQENLMSQKMKHLWDNYRSTLFSIFPDLEYRDTWARWEGKDTSLIAKTYSNDYFIKAREVDIWSEKSSIYNNIIYPKTGSNLPCFGMDLMGFFEKKIIIVFDFQHPKEKYRFSVEGLPKSEGDYRFFEPGYHISVFRQVCCEHFKMIINFTCGTLSDIDVFREVITRLKETIVSFMFW